MMPRRRDKRPSIGMRKRRNLFTGASFSIAPILATLGVITVLSYGTWVALPYIKGPSLALETPSQDPDGTVRIQGTAERVATVSINGLEIPLTDQGTFEVRRAYPPGYTVVVIQASDRFGRTREQTLALVTRYNDNHATEKVIGQDEEDGHPEEESDGE